MPSCSQYYLLQLVLVSTMAASCAERVDSGGAIAQNTGVVVAKSTPALVQQTSTGKEFHVTPDGRPGNDGKKSRPLDLATAISSQSPVKPGDTIWLHGGTYRGAFRASLAGTATQPIRLRQYTGERAIIDNPYVGDQEITHSPLWLEGNYLEVYDLEVTNSNPDRTHERPIGVALTGLATRAINLIIHDCGNGIFPTSAQEGGEVYGCVIFNNGWQDPTMGGTGHGCYFQNATGTKQLLENMVFNNYGWGFHGYSTKGSLSGIHVEGNVAFDNGSPSTEGSRPNLLIGGNTPAERITVTDNYFYRGSVDLHYTNRNNRDLVCTRNRIFGATEIHYWQSLQVTDNIFYFGRSPIVAFGYSPRADATSYTWDNNTYYYWAGKVPFDITGENFYYFEDWKKRTGFDRGSKFYASEPKGTEVFIRGNRYEAGRAHIFVFNWDKREAVEVDVSGVLKVGDTFEVRNAKDFFGPPVIKAKYDGKPLHLPLVGLRVAAPLGGSKTPGDDPQFSAFVMLPL
jgi:hypothetical protein